MNKFSCPAICSVGISLLEMSRCHLALRYLVPCQAQYYQLGLSRATRSHKVGKSTTPWHQGGQDPAFRCRRSHGYVEIGRLPVASRTLQTTSPSICSLFLK